mmetsp:Transcript_42565/g.76434  ORF Transcript_42565/g.76434 Transcript_42565/m.76434 type:complete len:201 (+) Transcript_42565:1839-2441(+)
MAQSHPVCLQRAIHCGACRTVRTITAFQTMPKPPVPHCCTIRQSCIYKTQTKGISVIVIAFRVIGALRRSSLLPCLAMILQQVVHHAVLVDTDAKFHVIDLRLDLCHGLFNFAKGRCVLHHFLTVSYVCFQVLKDLCDLVQLIAESIDPFCAGFVSIGNAIVVLFEGLELIYFGRALLHQRKLPLLNGLNGFAQILHSGL